MPTEEGVPNVGDDVRRLVDVGEFEKAKNILEQMVKSTPKNVSALMLLSDVYSKKGDLHTAERVLKRAYKLERQNDKLRFQLALIYKKIGGIYRKWKAKRLFKVCTYCSDYSIKSAANYHIRELKTARLSIQLANQTTGKREKMDISGLPNQSLTECPICGKKVEEQMRECPYCLRSPERFRGYSSRIKTMRYSTLVQELVRIGRKETPKVNLPVFTSGLLISLHE